MSGADDIRQQIERAVIVAKDARDRAELALERGKQATERAYLRQIETVRLLRSVAERRTQSDRQAKPPGHN